jgi:hypothetical protein
VIPSYRHGTERWTWNRRSQSDSPQTGQADGSLSVASPSTTPPAASRVLVGVYNVGVQATMHTGVPDDRLGRVTAAVSSLSNVVGPLGLLLGGVAGEALGANAVLLGGGVGIAVTGLLRFGVPSLREFGPPTRVESGAFG